VTYERSNRRQRLAAASVNRLSRHGANQRQSVLGSTHRSAKTRVPGDQKEHGIEWPETTREVGVGRGCPPTGSGPGRGCAPSYRNSFLYFDSPNKMVAQRDRKTNEEKLKHK